MKLALKNGDIFIADCNEVQVTVVKSLLGIKWYKPQKYWYGPASAELLVRLSKLCKLPIEIELEKQRLVMLQGMIDLERMKEEPTELYPYPVKIKMYKHQVRGANMAMLAIGLAEPRKVGDADAG